MEAQHINYSFLDGMDRPCVSHTSETQWETTAVASCRWTSKTHPETWMILPPLRCLTGSHTYARPRACVPAYTQHLWKKSKSGYSMKCTENLVQSPWWRGKMMVMAEVLLINRRKEREERERNIDVQRKLLIICIHTSRRQERKYLLKIQNK